MKSERVNVYISVLFVLIICIAVFVISMMSSRKSDESVASAYSAAVVHDTDIAMNKYIDTNKIVATKETVDTKEVADTKEVVEAKEAADTKEVADIKETADTKEGADTTETVNTNEEETEFTDGLIQPQSTETFPLDETGSGIEKKEFFSIDLNNDGVMDRIIRTRNENATAHFWDDYSVELNKKGKFENVSPEGLRTIEGADGSLQKIQFVFKPKFQIIKISRPWIYSWDNPTMATRTVYELQGDKIVEKSVKELKKVYDVSELFGNH
ncbi:MAG: hypothetical protein IKZ34_01300 [Alphaproteobacteria bacterium]|nr:hypothetical protein [Alphaproteobacteria bacterium]